MVEYTLLEKVKTVFNLITNSPLFLILLCGILLMTIDMLFISSKDKNTKIVYSVVSVLLIILFLYSYFNSIISIMDTISKNIVSLIYFPTILQYMFVLVISLIILVISVTSKKIKVVIKRINAFVLVVNSFLFFLILDQINKSNVDLSSKVSIYSNSILMILLELSILIFVLWIIGLSLYKIINKLSKNNSEISYIESKTFYEEPILPDNFNELQKSGPPVEYVVIEKEAKEEMFTLDEYKKMREFLEIINNKKEDDNLL